MTCAETDGEAGLRAVVEGLRVAHLVVEDIPRAEGELPHQDRGEGRGPGGAQHLLDEPVEEARARLALRLGALRLRLGVLEEDVDGRLALLRHRRRHT